MTHRGPCQPRPCCDSVKGHRAACERSHPEERSVASERDEEPGSEWLDPRCGQLPGPDRASGAGGEPPRALPEPVLCGQQPCRSPCPGTSALLPPRCEDGPAAEAWPRSWFLTWGSSDAVPRFPGAASHQAAVPRAGDSKVARPARDVALCGTRVSVASARSAPGCGGTGPAASAPPRALQRDSRSTSTRRDSGGSAFPFVELSDSPGAMPRVHRRFLLAAGARERSGHAAARVGRSLLSELTHEIIPRRRSSLLEPTTPSLAWKHPVPVSPRSRRAAQREAVQKTSEPWARGTALPFTR